MEEHLSNDVSAPIENAVSPRPLSLIIWLTILGITLGIVGMVLMHEVGRTLAHTRLVRTPDRVFTLLLLGAVGGLVLFGYGFVVSQRRRLVETTPTSSIRSIALGLVEVTGMTESSGSLLTAPFSNLPCVFYSYTVEEERGSGKSRRWETIDEGRSLEPFLVRDATGEVAVYPDGAETILQVRTYESDWLGRLPANVTEGLARLGVSTRGWLGSRTLRCKESSLLPGFPVYVLGTAQENVAQSGAQPVIGRAQDGQFIISDRTEKELLSRWSLQAHALVYGGPALTVGCLLAIFTWYLRIG